MGGGGASPLSSNLRTNPVSLSPLDLVLLLREAGSGQHAGSFAEVSHEVVTEVEGQGVLVGVQPPGQSQRSVRPRSDSFHQATSQASETQTVSVTQDDCVGTTWGLWVTLDLDPI